MNTQTLPGYAVQEALGEEEGYLLFRGTRSTDQLPVLIKLPGADQPPVTLLQRLEHEFQLRERLDPSWALVPQTLVRSANGHALVLSCPAARSLVDSLHGPVPVGSFLAIARSITRSLDAMHRRELIHKDLKPQNIWVAPDSSTAWLTGFGIAASASRETPPAIIEGTFAYMAPEQTGRMDCGVDHRADFYALGVIFYQLLAGELPLSGADPMAWVHAHLALAPDALQERRSDVPAVLSDLVMKLLQKDPAARYQTASGLEADLGRCQAEWQANSRIAPFPLGTKDDLGRFHLPTELYGRAQEVRLLQEAFMRVVATGHTELVMISGYAGVGKTALVTTLRERAAQAGGRFASGKVEQFKRGIPFEAITQALRELLLPVLSGSAQQLEEWRQRIQEALGFNAQLLIDLVPQMELILGPQPPVPELSLTEAENRFHVVFRRFLSVFAQDAPLVIFVDDLQWLDGASFKLLQEILTHPETRGLMLVGAYRDNEVSASHPLNAMLAAVRQGGSLAEISLEPLAIADLRQMIADALHSAPVAIEPLAVLILEKTGGNPFFAIQFLSLLAAERLIAYDPETSSWRWDEAKILERGFSNNVVELMVGKLRQLPAETQRALSLAACIGNPFDGETLALTSERSEQVIATELLPAIRDGLLVPAGAGHRFTHDRVQQAAYSLIPEPETAGVHLSIGRLLLSGTPVERYEERVFELTDHFNHALPLLEQAERTQVAELNLLAGKRARASAAYGLGALKLAAGMALLPPDAWETHYDLTYALHFHRAECEYLNGNLEGARALLDRLLERARGTSDRAAAFQLKITLHITLGQFAEVVAIGQEALASLGVDLPFPTSREQLLQEIEAVWEVLGDSPIESLVDEPLGADPEASAIMALLATLQPGVFFADVNFHHLAAARIVRLGLLHGHSAASPIGYVTFSWALGSMFGRYAEGYRFGKLACDLVDRYHLVGQKAQIFNVMGACANWTRTLGEYIAYERAGFEAGVEIGDLNMAGYCILQMPIAMFSQGAAMDQMALEVERLRDFTHKSKNQFQGAFVPMLLDFLHAMRDEAAEEVATFLPIPNMLATRGMLRLRRFLFYGDIAKAAEAEAEIRENLWAVAGLVQEFEYAYLAGLLAASRCGVDAEREAALAELRECCDRLGTWTRFCKQTFSDKHALLLAELARLEGKELEAMRHYDQAVRLARAEGFMHIEALANERAADFYLQRGFETSAHAYLREARHAYLRLGVQGKVQQLDRRYPFLQEPAGLPFTATFGAPTQQLDTMAIAKASMAISGEIILDKLLATLMQTVIQHAGADEGYLLQLRDGELWLAASYGEENVDLLHSPLSADSQLPLSLIQYVMRTKEGVILEDPARQDTYASERYFVQHQPKAVCCLPIVRQTRLVGILYLENSLAAGTFTRERVFILEVLAAQAAISLENATLFAERQMAEQEVRTLNAMLEQRVSERTAQLEEANKELEVFAYSVSHDLRAPLRAIMGFSHILLKEFASSLDEEGHTYLERIHTAGQKMAGLIDGLLELSRMSRHEMCQETVNLSHLAAEILEGLAHVHPERSVETVVAPEIMASGDERLLRAVLENLLGNAWKYTSHHPQARIAFGMRVERDENVFFVKDDGAGFDPEYAKNLFKPFQRLHRAEEFEGNGIGLATVQRIIHRHGGRLWAEGAVEQGATFYFTLGEPVGSGETAGS